MVVRRSAVPASRLAQVPWSVAMAAAIARAALAAVAGHTLPARIAVEVQHTAPETVPRLAHPWVSCPQVPSASAQSAAYTC